MFLFCLRWHLLYCLGVRKSAYMMTSVNLQSEKIVSLKSIGEFIGKIVNNRVSLVESEDGQEFVLVGQLCDCRIGVSERYMTKEWWKRHFWRNCFYSDQFCSIIDCLVFFRIIVFIELTFLRRLYNSCKEILLCYIFFPYSLLKVLLNVILGDDVCLHLGNLV